MSYSKKEKAEFFRVIDNLVEHLQDGLKMYKDMTLDDMFGELDFPVKYSEVKWSIKKIEGDFPTEERIKRLCASDEAVKAYDDEFKASMNYQYGEGGW